MPRIRIELPEEFSFTAAIPVRITDLNYGNHVGNDSILSIIHEARVQYLKQAGLAELEFEGAGLIMSDVGIEFKSELFYGDTVLASVKASGFSRLGFDLYYKLEKQSEGRNILIAAAKTGMICYDYTRKKIVPVPETARQMLEQKQL